MIPFLSLNVTHDPRHSIPSGDGTGLGQADLALWPHGMNRSVDFLDVLEDRLRDVVCEVVGDLLIESEDRLRRQIDAAVERAIAPWPLLSATEIAARAGCHARTVVRRCKAAGIPSRDEHGRPCKEGRYYSWSEWQSAEREHTRTVMREVKTRRAK